MELVKTLSALADESRLRLVRILSQGYFNVQELTSLLELSQPTVSHHLRVLQNIGLLQHHKEGTWSYYTLIRDYSSSPTLQVVERCLTALSASHDQRDKQQLAEDLSRVQEIVNRRRDQGRSFFESVASNWRALREEAQGADIYLERLLETIPTDGVLLELGCGSGALLEKILPRRGPTLGVDYSQAMLAEARAHLGSKAKLVDLRLGSLEHLPLGDQSVDTAVAVMVFHHLTDPRDALRDVLRVLRPEGQLALVDLAKHENEYMRERFGDFWLGFDAAEFTAWTEEVGFSDSQVEHLGANNQVFLLQTFKP